MALDRGGCGGRGWFLEAKGVADSRWLTNERFLLLWLFFSPTSKQKVRENVMGLWQIPMYISGRSMVLVVFVDCGLLFWVCG